MRQTFSLPPPLLSLTPSSSSHTHPAFPRTLAFTMAPSSCQLNTLYHTQLLIHRNLHVPSNSPRSTSLPRPLPKYCTYRHYAQTHTPTHSHFDTSATTLYPAISTSTLQFPHSMHAGPTQTHTHIQARPAHPHSVTRP